MSLGSELLAAKHHQHFIGSLRHVHSDSLFLLSLAAATRCLFVSLWLLPLILRQQLAFSLYFSAAATLSGSCASAFATLLSHSRASASVARSFVSCVQRLDFREHAYFAFSAVLVISFVLAFQLERQRHAFCAGEAVCSFSDTQRLRSSSSFYLSMSCSSFKQQRQLERQQQQQPLCS